MRERTAQSAADLPTEHDISHSYAIGVIEQVADTDTAVGDSLCEQTGKPPGSLGTSEWMAFVEAVHTYVEATYESHRTDTELAPDGERPSCGCDRCHETNVPNATHALQQLVACDTNDIDSVDAAVKFVREDIAAVRSEVSTDA